MNFRAAIISFIHVAFGKALFSFLLFSICFSTTFLHSFAQEASRPQKHWVFFRDKNEVSFDPYEYFDPKTIENRLKQHLPLADSTDFPVNETYIASVIKITDSVSHVTRWFNGAVVFADREQIERLQSLPFVIAVEPVLLEAEPASLPHALESFFDTSLSETKRKLLHDQTQRMGRANFQKLSIDGKGIRIAVLDAGFPAVDIHPAFEHLRKDKRILKTWDFVKNKEYVYDFNAHGTMVLSCIAGKNGEQAMGLATGAEFLLARTEMAQREPFAEEEYWLAAAEWADKNGANIISSSLAYTYHRYFKNDMTGEKSFVANAAKMAASKGILVVNAAGNDGTNEWKIIATPSDADSVLTVGGINPYTDYHINFSSYGPTADKRMKPNICAFGQVIAAGKKGITETYGTSFATPLAAGFAACAWQLKPQLTNMELFKEIERSGTLFPYFDYAHGFGVPQASYFTDESKSKTTATFDFFKDDFTLKVVIREEFFSSGNLNDELWPGMDKTRDQGYLYYHVENTQGYLDKYYVIGVNSREVLHLPLDKFSKGQKLRVFYNGYVEEFVF